MAEDRNFFAVLSIYIALLVCIVAVGAYLIVNRSVETKYVTVTETSVATEKVYVWAYPTNISPKTESNDEPEEERVWLIREYEERIGIFDENGALLDVIDVYVKTLPETDKNLLREGIRITSEQSLRAIIEDYSN